MVFAGLSILALILIHRSVILAVPFFLIGVVYMNYPDDIIPLTSYLSVLQQYRKLKKKEQVKQPRQLKFTKPTKQIKLPQIPTEIQLTVTGLVTAVAGMYGIYNSVFNENFAGLIVGTVLVALGIVILLAVVSPFLNKLDSENPNG